MVYRFLFDMSVRDGCTYTGHVGANCVHVLHMNTCSVFVCRVSG